MTDVETAARSTRWLFIVAGLAAAIVTVLRVVLGGPGDLEPLQRELADSGRAGILRINWHALTAIFVSLSLALFVGARAPRDAARAIGVLAAMAFGATAILFMWVSAETTGSPFTYIPYIPLGIAALLAAAAAWRA